MIATCQYCATQFEAKTNRRLFCSDRCKVRYNRETANSCFYCGQLPTDRDHVIPHSTMGLKHRVWSNLDYVNSCGECNRLLGAFVPRTITDKFDFLIEKFNRKHKLSKPSIQWDEDELEELSTSLARYVRSSMVLHNSRVERLEHMKLRRIQTFNAEQDLVRQAELSEMDKYEGE